MVRRKRILLLSPYDAMSHRQWREGVVRHVVDADFTVVTLPARYFAWRHRGNSLSLAHDPRLQQSFDLILATSMTDLSALKGMRPNLAAVPTVLYFHENQFAYPGGEQGVLERQITSIYSGLAADRLVFNSAYNRSTFMGGARELLKKMPDEVPAGIVDGLEARSTVMPVPLDQEHYRSSPARPGFDIVWNHRWEYDKGLQELQDVINGVIAAGLPCRFHLIGQQFRKIPAIMEANIATLRGSGRLGVCGFVESRDDYLDLLAKSHVVLSTSNHEFQGLAVLEAVAAGCVPLVPDRLVYPELFASAYRYQNSEAAVRRLLSLAAGVETPPDISHLSWSKQRDAWQHLLR